VSGEPQSAPTGIAPHRPPEWLFGVTAIPFGVAAGFVGSAMPFLLRNAGIAVEDIYWFTVATFLPTVTQFLYAPVIDLGLRRRSWLVLLSAAGAAFFLLALLQPLPSRAGLFLLFTVAGSWLTGLVGSCNGALMATTLPDGVRGRAGGFYNAGNLGGGALGAGVTMSLATHASTVVTGVATALMIVLPALTALAIAEPPPPRRPVREAFGTMVREVASTARSRPGWTGILLCVSPVGTAALVNAFSALGKDYRASDGMVTFVNGYLSGLVSAAGSLFGGWLADRVSRRGLYLVAGALTAACGLAMFVAPYSPSTYAVGVSAYLFISGICYAAFSAVVLETIGAGGSGGGASAATQYTLFTAAGNLAIVYTGWIDTRFHSAYGARGLLGVDAALNVAGIAALALLMRWLGSPRRAAVASG
jgi:MFS family permease